MMKRTKLIAANWKMNPPPEGCFGPASLYRSDGEPEIVVFPMATDIVRCTEAGLRVGGQCGRAEEKGAFTGDISMKTLKDLGCIYVLCGHSERRQYHGEKNADVAAQVQSALRYGLIPVICMGETEAERKAGDTESALRTNIETILHGVRDAEIVIAYEPVWAIGTGKTPTAAEAAKAHAFIRSLVPSPETRVIYGGSVTGKNASEFVAQPNVDGALVGGASLTPSEFGRITAAAGA